MGESNGKQGLFPSSFVDQQPESTSVIRASANEKELSKEVCGIDGFYNKLDICYVKNSFV